jgi:hypothetical protein
MIVVFLYRYQRLILTESGLLLVSLIARSRDLPFEEKAGSGFKENTFTVKKVQLISSNNNFQEPNPCTWFIYRNRFYSAGTWTSQNVISSPNRAGFKSTRTSIRGMPMSQSSYLSHTQASNCTEHPTRQPPNICGNPCSGLSTSQIRPPQVVWNWSSFLWNFSPASVLMAVVLNSKAEFMGR